MSVHIPSVAIVLVDLGTGERREVLRGDPQHEAYCDWARFHGIDPMVVPAGSELVRDPARCRVVYEAYVFDPPEAAPDPCALVIEGYDGVRVSRVSQGEAPPLLFPPPM